MSASTSALKRKRSGGHKVVYDPSWKSMYPRLVTVESDGVVTGLKCQWCTTHSSDCKRSRSFTKWWLLEAYQQLTHACVQQQPALQTHFIICV